MTPINDPRLTPDLKRIRSGSIQGFSKPGNRSFDPDFTIDPPEKHIYAELIDNQWCWVNGCPECKGEEPTYRNTYIKCVTHDVCCICSIPRDQLKEIPWSDPKGFKCKPCVDKTRGTNQVTCPYCNYEFEDSYSYYDSNDDVAVCDQCDNKFMVTAEQSITFTTDRIK